MAKAAVADGSLKRLGGGRWQTRDDRFTIEPQSGTWVVVDAEQTDDLGMPMIRGPFGSLGAAKEAIATAREGAPAVSPLAAKVAELRDRPRPAPGRDTPAGTATSTDPKQMKHKAPVKARPRPEPKPPAEPKWLTDLAPAARGRARGLIDALNESGASDAEGIARRDIVGKVPAATAYAIGRALVALGPDATPSDVARLLANGRNESLAVRWRLIDDDGRPITLDL